MSDSIRPNLRLVERLKEAVEDVQNTGGGIVSHGFVSESKRLLNDAFQRTGLNPYVRDLAQATPKERVSSSDSGVHPFQLLAWAEAGLLVPGTDLVAHRHLSLVKSGSVAGGQS